MLIPKHLPSTSTALLYLTASPFNKPLLHPFRPQRIRFASRYVPSVPPRKPPLPHTKLPPLYDAKDGIPGWPEYKQMLLKRCKTPEEAQILEEISPEEAAFIMNPSTNTFGADDAGVYKSMPENINYFSGVSHLETRIQKVEKIYEKYQYLPKASAHLQTQRHWKYANFGGGGMGEIDEFGRPFNEKSVSGRYKRELV